MTAAAQEAEHHPESREPAGPDAEASGQASPPAGEDAAVPLWRRATVRDALLIWVGTRAGMILAALYGALIVSGQNRAPLLERWKHWDVGLFRKIAEFGYDGDPSQEPDPGLPAIFPGMPLAMRLVHLVVDDWILAGLIISFVAGAVAMVALARLADFEGPTGAGRWAVLALVLCPTAVFLFAGYSEALFLAFALPAWLAARRRAWPLACALAAGASCVRITGLFLAAALIVEFVVSRTRRDGWAGWWRGAWLALPFAPILAYAAYQYSRTGDWLAWNNAQQTGWGRELVWPWQAFRTTWDSTGGDEGFAPMFRLEIAAVIVGVLLVVWLLLARRWAELVYVGLQLGALATSSFYMSIPRSVLLWWPLWVLIGRAGARYRSVIILYAAVIGPLMVPMMMSFLNSSWTG
ncbi:mannosyltransferase family protein [Microbispora sp. H11081]|uniref:mannosyltransferase family protein n=1 Tax=Microbispora sp. H11081 TaxID=2729107 RepID=UPI0028A24ECC|nr:mannosyltransferase family protein [Microbispora sp. H11081]